MSILASATFRHHSDPAVRELARVVELLENDHAVMRREHATVMMTAAAQPGDIKIAGVEMAMDGWLLCDGSAVDRGEYGALYEVIGDSFGAGDGVTTFNLPDLAGRAPVGQDTGQTEFDTLGETGGAKTHTLTEAQIPSHDHGLSQLGTTGNTATGGSSVRVQTAGGLGATTDNAGGGQAHNNLQPYQVVNFFIKT